MFRINVSDDSLNADFFCPFCKQVQEWPFGGRFLWKSTEQQEVFPEARHVILAHFLGDWNLERFGFKPCTLINKWENTTWERMDSDEGQAIDSGTVTMVRGFPKIQ